MAPILQRIPRGEALRFLLAGGSNTLFGVADTFICTWLFVRLNPAHAPLMASAATLVSTVLNITVSFLTYKRFVFRTRGNYRAEYARSLLVYLPSLLLSALAIVPLAALFAHWLPQPRFAPYAAQACIVAVSIVPQFVGHRKFTFRKQTAPPPDSASTP